MHKIFFSLLLALLPVQLGYHLWPAWSMVLGRRIDYLSPTLYLTDILIFCLLISWSFIKHKKITLPVFKIIIVAGFICLNIYFAASPMVAAFAWIKILEMIGLAAYIIHTKSKLSDIIFPLSVSVLYSSVIAILQFMFQHSLGLWILGERTFSMSTPGIARVDFNSLFKLRSYATFPHPNVLGGYLAVLVPLIIIQIKNKKKIFYLTTIVFGLIALVLTFSRSAWIIFVLSIAYIVYRKKKKFFAPVVFLMIVLFLVIGKTFGFQDEAVIVRQQLNAAAVSIFTSSPVVGSGLGNFLVRLPDHLVSRTVYFLQPVHNIYLLILAETGVIGFLIFLFLLWRTLRQVIRDKRHIACRLSLVAVLLLGLVDHYFLTLQQGQLLFTILLSLSLIQ